MKKPRNLRRLLGIALRCYQSTARLRTMPAGALVLPGSGHKHDEVRAELNADARGAPVPLVSPPRRGTTFDVGALRIMLRALPLLWRTHSSPLLHPYCEVLTHVHALSEVLAQDSERRHCLIIGDLSPYLIALAGACRVAGHKVIYWQYSFLDFKHMPIAADIAVILNDSGRNLAVPQGHPPPQQVFWRPRGVIAPLRVDALETGSLAAVLNVHADTRALRQLDDCSAALNRPIEVRLHPNSKLGDATWPEALKIAPEGEPLEAFGRRHALVLGGNTQAQVKLRVCGTPVVHCAGLDPLRFDHHDYVRSGILPGWRDPLEADFAILRRFYEAEDHVRALTDHLGPEPENRRPTLADLLSTLGTGRLAAANTPLLSETHGR